MLELTLVLIAGAAVLFVLLRPRRKAGVDKAADAARKAVEGRVRRGDQGDKQGRRDIPPLDGEGGPDR